MRHRNALIYLHIATIAIIILIKAAATTIKQRIISPSISYFNAVWSGGEDPFWPHVVLVPLSICAGVAVGAGIIFDREKFSKAIQSLALWLIVVGVPTESICTILLFAVDERISGAQQFKIIALEREAGPRILDDNAQDEIVNKLKPFGPQSYDLAVPRTLEPGSAIITQLLGILSRRLKWTFHSFPEGLLPTRTLSPWEALYVIPEIPSVITPSIGANFRVGIVTEVTGVHVESVRELLGVSFALCRALNDEYIVTACWPLNVMPLEPRANPALDNKNIHIYIGLK